jgi:hypothetical protein
MRKQTTLEILGEIIGGIVFLLLSLTIYFLAG